jgi:leader peptidase (prepilin peptidase) / N-methyltransferase
MTVLLSVLGLVGLVIGSFLNVVIYRVPRGESLIRPGSHCPTCQSPIRRRHNIPLLGWLILRGRCADCGTPIPLRYPIVEVTTAVLFVAIAVRLNQLHQLSALPAYLYFASIGLALTVIDIEVRRLPDAIVLPSYPVLAVLLSASAVWQRDWYALARAGLGSVALLGGFLMLATVYRGAMGYGDVKLAGILGAVLAYLSWSTLVIGAFAGFLFGALVGGGLILAGRAGRKTAIPFGPFMIAGAMLAIFAATPIASRYSDLLSWS